MPSAFVLTDRSGASATRPRMESRKINMRTAVSAPSPLSTNVGLFPISADTTMIAAVNHMRIFAIWKSVLEANIWFFERLPAVMRTHEMALDNPNAFTVLKSLVDSCRYNRWPVPPPTGFAA